MQPLVALAGSMARTRRTGATRASCLALKPGCTLSRSSQQYSIARSLRSTTGRNRAPACESSKLDGRRSDHRCVGKQNLSISRSEEPGRCRRVLERLHHSKTVTAAVAAPGGSMPAMQVRCAHMTGLFVACVSVAVCGAAERRRAPLAVRMGRRAAAVPT